MKCYQELHDNHCLHGEKKKKKKWLKWHREEKIRLYLFQFEDVLVEVVLEPFVGEVNAELFEAVVLIILKAKDVQDSYGQDLVKKTDSSFQLSEKVQ